jgi:hypothetical protein
MEKAKMLSVLLVESEHEILQEMASEFGIKKSEIVRSLIQGAYVAHMVQKAINKGEVGTSVEYGGYGFEINFDAIKGIYDKIITQLDGMDDAMEKGVKVIYNRNERTPFAKRMKSNKVKETT